ncbi:hypothetical protein [Streptomyces sp. NPDC019937]|uniref:hypothetical protein n=1 Tax=Streptomyces sp. NPDC019937 TaxID=3154787 RepID=UPI0033CC84E4
MANFAMPARPDAPPPDRRTVAVGIIRSGIVTTVRAAAGLSEARRGDRPAADRSAVTG